MPIMNTIVAGNGGSGTRQYNTTVYELLGIPDTLSYDTGIELIFDGITKPLSNSLRNKFNAKAIDPNSATDNYFYVPEVKSVEFPDLQLVGKNGLYQTFKSQGTLTYADMPKLFMIEDSGFYGTFAYTGLEEFTLPALTGIDRDNTFYEAFRDSSIKLAYMRNLTKITGNNSFQYSWAKCLQLKGLWMPSLSFISSRYNFENACESISDVTARFPALASVNYKDSIGQFLTNVSNGEVHFPIAMQNFWVADASQYFSNLPNVLSGFGSTGTTVSFDIVQMIIDNNGDKYNRREDLMDETEFPNFSYMAWDMNGNIYYTANLEPQIGDNIYSDESLSTIVATISSIG